MREVTFELLGKSYTVRPEFRKVAAIENMTGKGTIEILQDIAESKFKLTDMVHVLFCMAGDQRLTVDKVASEVMGNAMTFMQPILVFLNDCNIGSDELTGDTKDDGSKEKKD